MIGLGQPVDRLVRQRAIDPGLQIKGQQLLNGRGGFGRHGEVMGIEPNLGSDCAAAKRREGISMVVLAAKIGNNAPLRSVLNRAETRS